MTPIQPTIAPTPAARQRVVPETRPRMVTVDLRKAELDPWRLAIGCALQRAVSLCGWSLKEFAGKVGRDERQVGRWFTGKERPQLDALFAVERLQQPLIQALGELAGADVEVTVRLRRSA